MILAKAQRKTPPQRRFVDEPPANEFWQIAHREADKAYPALRQMLLDTFGAVEAIFPQGEIVRLLTSGDESAVVAVLLENWTTAGEASLSAMLPEIFQATMFSTAESMEALTEAALAGAPGPEIVISFNTANPRAIAFAEELGAARVVEISETTREGIRQVVSRGFTEGRAPTAVARELRQVVGLTDRQGQALGRFRQGLEGSGRSAKQIQALVEKKAKAFLRQRTQTIARHETLLAANNGQDLLWRTAQDDGFLDPFRTKRRFVVTRDDRTCPICAPMGGQLRGMREPFVSPFNGVTALFPPIHIQCRCSTTLVITEPL